MSALLDLYEVQKATFGTQAGDCPDVYADYDRLVELCGKMTDAVQEVEDLIRLLDDLKAPTVDDDMTLSLAGRVAAVVDKLRIARHGEAMADIIFTLRTVVEKGDVPADKYASASFCHAMYAADSECDADDYWVIHGLPYRMASLGATSDRDALVKAAAFAMGAIEQLDRQAVA